MLLWYVCQCSILSLSYLYLTIEPLGGVRSLRLTDPTTSTLNVQWEAAEGNVRQYRVFYVPTAGGEEEMVSWRTARHHTQCPKIEADGNVQLHLCCDTTLTFALFFLHLGAGIRQHLQQRAEEPAV